MGLGCRARYSSGVIRELRLGLSAGCFVRVLNGGVMEGVRSQWTPYGLLCAPWRSAIEHG